MSNRCNKLNRRWINALALGLFLLCAWTRLEMAAYGSVLDFGASTDASNVANTGLSELLGEIILTAKASCGTETDAFCVNDADTIQVRYSNITIDNTAATGILVCETVNGTFLCNQDATLMNGVITVTDDTV